MPKAEKGSIKDLGNRIKAKGLQKLKYYCQMCEKQCRDANGFKCHLTSEHHLRQMKIFSDNAGGILDTYSKDFEKLFMTTLRMRHGTKKVNANNVYQEVISDKQHIHMNATHWTTLTEFVQYLGKTGKCVVEETERGWFVSYIERDVSILARKEALARREAAEKAAEEAQAQRMELQRVEAAKALDRAGGTVHMEATKMERSDKDPPIQVSVKPKTVATSASTKPTAAVFGDDDDDEDDENDARDIPAPPTIVPPPITPPELESKRRRDHKPTSSGRKRDNTDDKDDHRQPNKKQKDSKIDYWLYRDIAVRVVSKKLDNGRYFRKKAIVDKVIDKYTAQVIMDENDGDVLQLDQDDLETVIPKQVGEKVRILKGRYRGEKAKVEHLDKKLYQATLRLKDSKKSLLENVPFEDFSKIA